MGHDDIWHEPVMPTAEEYRMMDAARTRIEAKEQIQGRDWGRDDCRGAFSWKGLLIALVIRAALVLLGRAVFVSLVQPIRQLPVLQFPGSSNPTQ